MKPLRSGVAVAAFTLLCGSVALAQAAPSPSPSAPPEIGRVSTSDRHDEPVGRTSRPTFVVTRAQIDATGARTVADALRSVPGIRLSRYGGFGAQVDYGIRGSTSAQTLVLVDGTPIAAGSNGIVDLGSYPTTGVARIEVVESAGSTLYGSNAIGGIINIITAPQRTGARVSTGTYGERDIEVEAGNGRLGAAFERHLTRNDYAYPALRYTTDPAGNYPSGVRANATAEQSTGRLSYRAVAGRGFALRAQAGVDAIVTGVPGAVTFLTPNATQPQSRANVLLEVTHAATRGGSTTLTLSGARQALGYVNPDFGGGSFTYDGRAGLSLRHALATAGGDLIAGADFFRESALFDFGPGAVPPRADGRLAQSALYAQYSAALGRGDRLIGGLRGENDGAFGRVLVPSIGTIVTAGAARLAANYGGAFRVPTLVDLYFPGFSNPSLKPERTRNLDVTLAFPDVLGGVSAGLFDRRGSNLITLDQNFVPQNAQRATVRGLQLTAQTRAYRGLVADASVTNVFRATDDVAGTRLARQPVTRATVGFMRPFSGTSPLAFGARAVVVGSSYDNGAVLPITGVLDAYTDVDAYVRYRIFTEAILTLRALNAGNERAAPVYGYPMPGRRLELELSTH